jgi:hypothetical protein
LASAFREKPETRLPSWDRTTWFLSVPSRYAQAATVKEPASGTTTGEER